MRPVNTRAWCPVSCGLEAINTVGWWAEFKTRGADMVELLLDLNVLTMCGILTTFPCFVMSQLFIPLSFTRACSNYWFNFYTSRSIHSSWIVLLNWWRQLYNVFCYSRTLVPNLFLYDKPQQPCQINYPYKVPLHRHHPSRSSVLFQPFIYYYYLSCLAIIFSSPFRPLCSIADSLCGFLKSKNLFFQNSWGTIQSFHWQPLK